MKAVYRGAIAVMLAATLSARAELVSAVQVVVNREVITYGQIVSALAQLPAPPDRNPTEFARAAEKLKNDEIEELVERQLILHAFMADGYATNLLEAFIEDRIKEDVKKKFYDDHTRLIKTLREQGISYEMFRRQERDNIILEYMRYQNTSPKKILISPLKVQNYYNTHLENFKVDDQVKLKMIAINQPVDAAPGTAHKVADEILRKIDDGVPFSEMASVYSSGPQRAEGGDRGWVERHRLTTELDDAAFSLKAGEHSKVIELKNGACYLLMVEKAQPAHVKELTEVRDEVERILMQEESARLRQKWMERIKAKSFVRYY